MANRADPDTANQARHAASRTKAEHHGVDCGAMIEPLALDGNEAVADLIDNVFGGSGFNARRLAEAASLYSRMLREPTTVALTVSGAMTPIGMSGPIISLIERGFVDVIISTGANLYHDLHRAFDMPMGQGHFAVDDDELAASGIARIFDVFIADRATLNATDQVLIDAFARLDASEPMSTARLHWELGRILGPLAPHPERSLLITAQKCDVPIYVSAPGDSSIAIDLAVAQIDGHALQIDPVLDVWETAAIVYAAEKNGVIQIGGGSPKNFYLQTEPTVQQLLRDPTFERGHDYFIQLTTDSPQWGGLSGATPAEARSWGKVKEAYTDSAVVYSCASLTFPLLAQYVLVRNEPRPLRRLYPQLADVTARLREQAREYTRTRPPLATM